MPALSNRNENKYFGDLLVDKETEDVIYNDEQHLYISKRDGKKNISVTTIIEHYSEDYDAAFWSAYKALEALLDLDTWIATKKTLLATKKFNPKLPRKLGIDETIFAAKVLEIQAEWAEKNREACEHGSKVHKAYEDQLNSSKTFDFGYYGYKDWDGEYECRETNYKLDIPNGVYPEMLLSWESDDGILRICGQADCIVKRGNQFVVIDHKTNGEIKQKSYFNRSTKKYKTMKFPLTEIMDTNYWHYCLQLSLYAWIIMKKNPGLELAGLTLNHIDREGKQTLYNVPYMWQEVEKMIKHYHRELIKKNAYDALKPFIE